jgi:hypothetical protein
MTLNGSTTATTNKIHNQSPSGPSRRLLLYEARPYSRQRQLPVHRADDQLFGHLVPLYRGRKVPIDMESAVLQWCATLVTYLGNEKRGVANFVVSATSSLPPYATCHTTCMDASSTDRIYRQQHSIIPWLGVEHIKWRGS